MEGCSKVGPGEHFSMAGLDKESIVQKVLDTAGWEMNYGRDLDAWLNADSCICKEQDCSCEINALVHYMRKAKEDMRDIYKKIVLKSSPSSLLLFEMLRVAPLSELRSVLEKIHVEGETDIMHVEKKLREMCVAEIVEDEFKEYKQSEVKSDKSRFVDYTILPSATDSWVPVEEPILQDFAEDFSQIAQSLATNRKDIKGRSLDLKGFPAIDYVQAQLKKYKNAIKKHIEMSEEQAREEEELKLFENLVVSPSNVKNEHDLKEKKLSQSAKESMEMN